MTKYFESSVIIQATYCKHSKTMFLALKPRLLYFYRNVPQEIWEGFINAESAGTFFNKHIKDKLEYERLVKI